MVQGPIEESSRWFVRLHGRMTIIRIVKAYETRYSRVSGRMQHGGWDAINEASGRSVHIKSKAKLRKSADGFKYDGGKLMKVDSVAGPHPAEMPRDVRNKQVDNLIERMKDTLPGSQAEALASTDTETDGWQEVKKHLGGD